MYRCQDTHAILPESLDLVYSLAQGWLANSCVHISFHIYYYYYIYLFFH